MVEGDHARLREHQEVLGGAEETIVEETGRVPSPRLSRHTIALPDGHQVSVAVAGRGVPFVVVHGFMAEGFIYAQTLSRLVALGYKVVAVDTAAHGGTDVLPEAEIDFDAYVDLFSRVLDHLGIRRAVLVGHSMGGRLVAELGAAEPERALALLLVDPIVGRSWDRIAARARMFPPLLAWRGFLIGLDTLTTIPVLRDREQTLKLLRLLAPSVTRIAARPWRLLAPAIAILRSGSSRITLETLRRQRVPTMVVHGERDLVVPLETAVDAAQRSGGHLVVVRKAPHSWLLKDPETLPAVVQHLAEGPLGDAHDRALEEAGLDPETATVDEIEEAFFEPGSLAVILTPELEFDVSEYEHQPAKFEFSQVEVSPEQAPG